MLRLLIRADASPQIGSGHVMRCLALSQAAVQQGGQVIMLLNPEARPLQHRLEQEGLRVRVVAAPSGTLEDAREVVQQSKTENIDGVIIDGYVFNEDYQRFLKENNIKLLCIDDYGHASHYYSDIILNQNIYASPDLYPSRESYTSLLLGSPYILFRQEFWQWSSWKREFHGKPHKILVTLGGGDVSKITEKVIRAIQAITLPDLEVIAIVKNRNLSNEWLWDFVNSSEINIQLLENINDMPALMAWADIAITGGGSTCWETALMKLPNLVIVLADNQIRIVEVLSSLRACLSLGKADSLTEQDISSNILDLLLNTETRLAMIEAQGFISTANGASRTLKRFREIIEEPIL